MFFYYLEGSNAKQRAAEEKFQEFTLSTKPLNNQPAKYVNDENYQRNLSMHTRIQPGIFSDVNVNYAEHVNKALISDMRRLLPKFLILFLLKTKN